MDVAVIVTAILVSGRLRLFVQSLKAFHPDIKIYIGAQGALTPPIDDLKSIANVEIVELPFDCGISAARNALIARASEPYVLICDDDFIFTAENGIFAARSIFDAHPDICIVGGRLKEFAYLGDGTARSSGEQAPAHNFIHDSGLQVLIKYPISLLRPEPIVHRDRRAYACDMVLNFCLIHKELIVDRGFRWDERIKIYGRGLTRSTRIPSAAPICQIMQLGF